MVRSLWTAATGMVAQQTNIDTISNNLANVNTLGYKAEVAEFKTLLYQTLQTKATTANIKDKPIGAQVGLGVRNASITSNFKSGNFYESASTSSFAIDGNGFFAVKGSDGKTYYTRNGSFNWSVGSNGLTLTTTDGNPVLDTNGRSIVLSGGFSSNKVSVSSSGEVCYPDTSGNAQTLGIKIGIFQFQNPAGLEKLDSSLYDVTAASGNAMNEATSANLRKSSIAQGFLEGSNVQVVDEMVNMIVAQRAYELNSKAIQASDEMLQQANSLRR